MVNMKEQYQRYAELEAQIKLLEEEKNTIKSKIMGSMIENSQEKLETEFGKFTITKLKKWEYPVSVVNKEVDYKTAKSNAELDGTATYTENASIRFTPVK